MMNYEVGELYRRWQKVSALNEVNLENAKRLKERIATVEKRKSDLDELLVAVQECAKRTQSKIKERFEAIVQSCIDVVFPNTYKFQFDFVAKRGKTEVNIRLLDSFGNELDPMKSNGGGLVDVISLALRVACLSISGKEKVLLLDEPMKCIRGEAKIKMGEILAMLSKTIGIQIIAISDVSGNSIAADREFILTKSNNISNVKTKEKETEDYDK